MVTLQFTQTYTPYDSYMLNTAVISAQRCSLVCFSTVSSFSLSCLPFALSTNDATIVASQPSYFHLGTFES